MSLSTVRALLGAELLKLRRQRPLMAFATVLSVGVVAVFMGYLQLRHAGNPARYPPAGGMDGFRHLLRALGVYFGALAAILIGSEAGTADQASGVFRDLVATGRSRLTLFAVRLPAAVALTLGFSAAAYAVGLLGVFWFAGGGSTPSASLVLQGAAWIALANSMLAVLAVGIGSLTGSRAVTLTAVIGWQMVATQLILNVTSLGSVRELLLRPAVAQLAPVGPGLGLTMATGTAVAVLAGWAVLPMVIGAWHTRRCDV